MPQQSDYLAVGRNGALSYTPTLRVTEPIRLPGLLRGDTRRPPFTMRDAPGQPPLGVPDRVSPPTAAAANPPPRPPGAITMGGALGTGAPRAEPAARPGAPSPEVPSVMLGSRGVGGVASAGAPDRPARVLPDPGDVRGPGDEPPPAIYAGAPPPPATARRPAPEAAVRPPHAPNERGYTWEYAQVPPPPTAAPRPEPDRAGAVPPPEPTAMQAVPDDEVVQWLRDHGREDLALDVAGPLQMLSIGGENAWQTLVALDRVVSEANIPVIEGLAAVGRAMVDNPAIDAAGRQGQSLLDLGYNLGQVAVQSVTPGGQPLQFADAATGNIRDIAYGNTARAISDTMSGGSRNAAGAPAPVSAAEGSAPQPTMRSEGQGSGAAGGALSFTGRAPNAGGGQRGGRMTVQPGALPGMSSGALPTGGFLPASVSRPQTSTGSRPSGGGGAGGAASSPARPSGATAASSGAARRPRDITQRSEPGGSRLSAEALNRAVANPGTADEGALRQLARGNDQAAVRARRELQRRRTQRGPLGETSPTRGTGGLY